MLKKKRKLSALIFICLIGTTLTAGAFEYQYVGSIDQSLQAPTSLAVSADQLAVLEPFYDQLKIFSSDGIMTHQVNICGDANGLSRLDSDRYLFCDMNLKKIIAIDYINSTQVDYFENAYNFINPTDVLVINNSVYVLDAGLNKIIKFDASKNAVKTIDLIDSEQNNIEFASSFTFNSSDNRFYIFDQTSSTIWTFESNGNFISTFGSFGGDIDQITRGGEIVSNQDNFIYISDRYQSRVVIYDTDGNFAGNLPSSADAGESLYLPTGMAIDENGMLYVASTESARVQMYYVKKTTGTNQTMATENIFPQAMDSLALGDVRLISISYSQDIRSIDGFDFQLYDVADTTTIISEGIGIIPVSGFDSTLNSYFYRTEWTPSDLKNDMAYNWRSRVVADGTAGDWSAFSSFKVLDLPQRFELHQNYPNPFNPITNINFSLPVAAQVKLEIFNITGQLINVLIDETIDAGNHEITWAGQTSSGNQTASGIYFYRLSAGEFVKVKKMVLIK